jgi:hypothetical protein
MSLNENKILVIHAHPKAHKSRINNALIDEVDKLEGITLHQLYELYPDFHIEIKKEQELLVSHDIIVFQHPFYWYSCPALLKEYIAYRILNTMTDWSFRVRLLRIRYVESDGSGDVIDTYGVLIEHRDQLAKRIGMEVDDSESTTVAALDGAHTNVVSLFQFLIGNTDFSPIKGVPGERCCHNHELLKNDDTQISVPYDFDISGIVSPPHARPNPRFNLKNVKERLYRGRCANNERLETSLAMYRDRRDAIYGLISDLEPMSKSEKTKTTRYVENFYKVIDTPRLLKKDIVKDCLGP